MKPSLLVLSLQIGAAATASGDAALSGDTTGIVADIRAVMALKEITPSSAGEIVGVEFAANPGEGSWRNFYATESVGAYKSVSLRLGPGGKGLFMAHLSRSSCLTVKEVWAAFGADVSSLSPPQHGMGPSSMSYEFGATSVWFSFTDISGCIEGYAVHKNLATSRQ